MTGALDKIRLGLALLLLAGGVAGFYYLSEQAMVLRVLSVLAGVGLAAAVAAFTETGRRFIGFSKDSVDETRKVVWPTRKETLQTTAVVFGLVVVMAIFLWAVDGMLAWGVKRLMGWGD